MHAAGVENKTTIKESAVDYLIDLYRGATDGYLIAMHRAIVTVMRDRIADLVRLSENENERLSALRDEIFEEN
jgi:hypothetical protein